MMLFLALSFDNRGYKYENCAGATIWSHEMDSDNKEQRSDPKNKAVPKDPPPDPEKKPKELGGPTGPEPTRYGDWERKGRCIDF